MSPHCHALLDLCKDSGFLYADKMGKPLDSFEQRCKWSYILAGSRWLLVEKRLSREAEAKAGKPVRRLL